MRTTIFVLALCCLFAAKYDCLEAVEEEEMLPSAAEEQARSCIKLGEYCDGSKDDCQCCRTNGYCSCYSLFGYLKSGCKCVAGSPAEFQGICYRKSKCANRGQWGHPKVCKYHKSERRGKFVGK